VETHRYRAAVIESPRTEARIPLEGQPILAEATGQSAELRVIARRGAQVISDRVMPFRAWQNRKLTFDFDPGTIQIHAEVVAGKGKFIFIEEARDLPRLPSTTLPAPTAARISASLSNGLSPFQAAPYQDPDTGLIFLRGRWLDPHRDIHHTGPGRLSGFGKPLCGHGR
jgi:hypothetical protein